MHFLNWLFKLLPLYNIPRKITVDDEREIIYINIKFFCWMYILRRDFWLVRKPTGGQEMRSSVPFFKGKRDTKSHERITTESSREYKFTDYAGAANQPSTFEEWPVKCQHKQNDGSKN